MWAQFAYAFLLIKKMFKCVIHRERESLSTSLAFRVSVPKQHEATKRGAISLAMVAHKANKEWLSNPIVTTLKHLVMSD